MVVKVLVAEVREIWKDDFVFLTIFSRFQPEDGRNEVREPQQFGNDSIPSADQSQKSLAADILCGQKVHRTYGSSKILMSTDFIHVAHARISLNFSIEHLFENINIICCDKTCIATMYIVFPVFIRKFLFQI